MFFVRFLLYREGSTTITHSIGAKWFRSFPDVKMMTPQNVTRAATALKKAIRDYGYEAYIGSTTYRIKRDVSVSVLLPDSQEIAQG